MTMSVDGLTPGGIGWAIAATGLFAIQATTCAMTIHRCRRPPQPIAVLPPLTLVIPLRGVETFSEQTLRSAFGLDYPEYEILFCLADAHDPIRPLVEAAIAGHPARTARLLVGEVALNENPKLNNMAKGWTAARHDFIAFVDSNVLLPTDFLRRAVTAWRADTGVVSAPPVGYAPDNFASILECAFLNSHEARWQYAADCAGVGFAQGKLLLLRKSIIGECGLAALAAEPAEDAATTKLVRRLGLRARLAGPSPQPLGRRDLRSVWDRQLRWARLRRYTFPVEFAPEILTGSVVPILTAIAAAQSVDAAPAWVVGGYVLAWYGVELATIVACRWPIGWLTLPALALRDLLLPALWVGGWAGTRFTWHGATREVRQRSPALLDAEGVH